MMFFDRNSNCRLDFDKRNLKQIHCNCNHVNSEVLHALPILLSNNKCTRCVKTSRLRRMPCFAMQYFTFKIVVCCEFYIKCYYHSVYIIIMIEWNENPRSCFDLKKWIRESGIEGVSERSAWQTLLWLLLRVDAKKSIIKNVVDCVKLTTDCCCDWGKLSMQTILGASNSFSTALRSK